MGVSQAPPLPCLRAQAALVSPLAHSSYCSSVGPPPVTASDTPHVWMGLKEDNCFPPNRLKVSSLFYRQLSQNSLSENLNEMKEQA